MTGINEKVLHYLLKLPPALEIQSVVCDAMVISVPWLRLSTDPLTVDITNVKVVVAEIDHETEQYKCIPEVDFLLELILSVSPQLTRNDTRQHNHHHHNHTPHPTTVDH